MGAVFTPIIVTVLPVLNEEKYIEACLHSLIRQSYPSNLHSIIVLDGGSTDRTEELVREAAKYAESTGGPSIELHHNPGKFLGRAKTALNLKYVKCQWGRGGRKGYAMREADVAACWRKLRQKAVEQR